MSDEIKTARHQNSNYEMEGIMKKLHTYVLKQWPFYLLALISMFIAIGLDMLYPQVTKIIINEVLVSGDMDRLAGLLGIICNFYAVDRLVLSDASILNKMSPFFVVIFSFLILREKPAFVQVITVCGAFLGALFVIKPSFHNAQFLPSVIGFMGGACAGIAYTFVRKATLSGENSAYVVFFFSFVSTVITLPLFIFFYKKVLTNAFVCGIL